MKGNIEQRIAQSNLISWLGSSVWLISNSAAVVATQVAIMTAWHLAVWHIFFKSLVLECIFESSYYDIHSPCFCMAILLHVIAQLVNDVVPLWSNCPPLLSSFLLPCLTNHMESISCHIMPLVINILRGDTHIHTDICKETILPNQFVLLM